MNILLFHPEIVVTAALMLLVVIVLSLRHPRPWVMAAMMIALLPVLPIITVRLIAFYVVLFCDWLTADRIWTKPSAYAARWLQDNL